MRCVCDVQQISYVIQLIDSLHEDRTVFLNRLYAVRFLLRSQYAMSCGRTHLAGNQIFQQRQVRRIKKQSPTRAHDSVLTCALESDQCRLASKTEQKSHLYIPMSLA